jgi:hypothetical protein
MAACDPSVYRITLVHVICEIILSKIVATLFDLWVKGLLADASDFFLLGKIVVFSGLLTIVMVGVYHRLLSSRRGLSEMINHQFSNFIEYKLTEMKRRSKF